MHLNGGKLLKCHLNGITCRKWANGLKIYDSEKTIGPQGSVCPHPGSIYLYITKIFKDLFSETALPIKANFYMEHLQEEGINVYINNLGHVTKMVAMPIYDKNPSKIFSSGTG